MPLDLEAMRSDAGKLDLTKMRADAARLPPQNLNAMAASWLMPPVELSTPSIEQQVKDAFGVASRYGVPLEQAEQMVQQRTFAQDLVGVIQKGGLTAAKGIVQIPADELRAAFRVGFTGAKIGNIGGGLGPSFQFIPRDKREQMDVDKAEREMFDDPASPLYKVVTQPTEYIAGGIADIVRNHPEWDTEPPKNVLDLLTNPRKLALAIAQSTPVLVASGLLMATGHPIAAAHIIYGAEAQEAEDGVLAAGGTKEQARQARALYGVPAAALELFQLDKGIALTKEIRNLIIARSAQRLAAQGVGAATKQGLAKTIVQEVTTEIMQGAWQEKTGGIVAGIEQPGGWKGYIDRRAQEAVIAAALTLTAGGAGAVLGASQRGRVKGEPVTTEDGWMTFEYGDAESAEAGMMQMFSISQMAGKDVQMERRGNFVRVRTGEKGTLAEKKPSLVESIQQEEAEVPEEEQALYQYLVQKAESGDEAAWDQLQGYEQSKTEQATPVLGQPGQPPIAKEPAVADRGPGTISEQKPPETMTPTEAKANPFEAVAADGEEILAAWDRLRTNWEAGEKRLRERVPDELREHAFHVSLMVGRKKPVSAVAVDSYGVKLPNGYSREGDFYVFKEVPSGAATVLSSVAETGAETVPPAAVPESGVEIARTEEAPKEATRPKKSAKSMQDLILEAIDREEKQMVGEELLAEMDQEGVSPREIHEFFWREVYPNLPEREQRRFERGLYGLTGIKPGGIIRTDPKTHEGERAQSWQEIADGVIGAENSEGLEGIEHGFVVYEAIANRAYQDSLRQQGMVSEPDKGKAQLPTSVEGSKEPEVARGQPGVLPSVAARTAETATSAPVPGPGVPAAATMVGESAAVKGGEKGAAPGQTLTLYHGTDRDVGVQDLRAAAPQYEGSLGEGIYFGQDRQTAKFYGKNVLEVPVRIANPLVIDAAEGTNYRAEPGAEAQRNETGAYDSILPGEQIIPFDVQIGGQWVPIRNADDLASLSRRAQAAGHDALIVRGIRDNATVNEEVVVFDRNQIGVGREEGAAESPVTLAPLPQELQGLAENAQGMTKEQFLSAYEAGLAEQNLTRRETAQKIDAYLKRNLKLTPGDFYDRYVKAPAAVPPEPAAKTEAPGPEAMPIEVIMLFDELRANRVDWKKAGTARKAELMARNQEIAGELMARGYDKAYVKAVETGKQAVPEMAMTEQPAAPAEKPQTFSNEPIAKEEKNYLKNMGFAVSDILKMEPAKAREMIVLHKKAGRKQAGFLRFRFDKEADTKAKMAKALADFEKWLGTQPGTPQVSTVERTEPEVLEGPWDEEKYRADFEKRFQRKPSDTEVDRASRMYRDKVQERKFITTLKEEGFIPKETKAEYHVRNTDALAIKAANLVREDIDAAERMALRGTDDNAIAVLSELIKEYHRREAAETDPKKKNTWSQKVLDLSLRRAPVLTEAGRTVQAASIISLNTPEGMVQFAVKTIEQYNEAHPKKKLPNLTAEQVTYLLDELRAIKAMPNGMEKAKQFGKIMDYVQGLTPSTEFEKIMAVIKAGLLTGIKTSGLNTTSNLMHGVTEVGKDVPATFYDWLLSQVTGKRTLTFVGKGSIEGFQKGLHEGWTYFRTGWSERDNIGEKLDWKRTKFQSKFGKTVLQPYVDFVFRALGAEDQPFYYGAMFRSLAGQSVAQAMNEGLTGDKAKSRAQEILDNPTDEMLTYAVLDAETAVFQNKTALGDIAAYMTRKIPGLELVVPFKRTPSAIAMQIVNYSPVGFVKTAVENWSNFDQRVLAQELGRATLGTGVMWLGAELFKLGLMTLDRPESEREKELWKLEGRAANSIKIGDKWRSVQVLGPAGNVLIIGGHFAEGFRDTGSVAQGVASAWVGGAKSFSEQTFMRGLNVAVDALVKPERSIENFTSSLAGMVVPTLLADIARAMDESERRSTGLGWQRIKSRVPGLRETLEPSINVFGQDLPRYGGNVLEVMLDPTRPAKIREDVVVDEIRRLYDAGQETAAPTLLGDRKGYKGLTDEQNTELWRRAGEQSYVNIFQTMQGGEYAVGDDEAKAKLIDRAVQDGKTAARAETAYVLLDGLPEDERLLKMLELKAGGLITQEVTKELERLR